MSRNADDLIDLVWDTCVDLAELGCSAEGIEEAFVYPPGMGSEIDREIVANEIRNVVRAVSRWQEEGWTL